MKYKFNQKELSYMYDLINLLYIDIEKISREGAFNLFELKKIFDMNIYKNNFIIYNSTICTKLYRELLKIQYDFMQNSKLENPLTLKEFNLKITDFFNGDLFKDYLDNNAFINDADRIVLIKKEFNTLIKTNIRLRNLFKVSINSLCVD